MNYKLCTKVEDKWRTFGFVNDGKNGGQYASINLTSLKALVDIVEKSGKDKVFLSLFEDKIGKEQKIPEPATKSTLDDEVPWL